MDIEDAPAPLRQLPSWLVSQAALLAQRTVNDRLGAVGGHRREFSLLTALDESGPDSQAALSRRCGIDRSDMVALVNDLAGAGLVERRTDDADRRRNVVSLTAAGAERLHTLRAVVGAAQDELLAPLSASERDRLVGLLTAVLERHAPATSA
jgi:MarR family transcriptional regulator, lower aerobic nicotinate degradation pathway regulator